MKRIVPLVFLLLMGCTRIYHVYVEQGATLCVVVQSEKATDVSTEPTVSVVP